MVEGDGASRREHLEAVARQGIRPARLDGPPLPDQLASLWAYWQEIHAGRTQNGMAPSRASSLDIMAWEHLTGIKLRRWEYRAVMQIGGAWLRVQIGESERQRKLAEAKSRAKGLH